MFNKLLQKQLISIGLDSDKFLDIKWGSKENSKYFKGPSYKCICLIINIAKDFFFW